MKDEQVYAVYRTTDYDKFIFIDDNREVTKSRAEKIEESILDIGYRKVPVTVNKKMQVIDGQGRTTALKKLGMPIDYIIDETADINVCRRLNQGQTNWKPMDYIKSYAKSGESNYINLLELIETYPKLPLQVIAGVTMGIIVINGWAIKPISSGEYKLSKQDMCKSLEVLDFLNSLRFELDSIKGSKRVSYTIAAWVFSQDGVDKKKLEKIYREKYPIIIPSADIIQSLTQLSDLYNKGLKDKSKKMYFEIIYKESL